MAIAVGSVSNTPTYLTRVNTTIVAPTGISDGDLLVAVISVGNATTTPVTVTPASGFTLRASTSDNNAVDYVITTKVYTKKASGESGNYTFTHSSADTEAFMYRLTGVDGTTPVDVTPVTDNKTARVTAGGNTFTLASIALVSTSMTPVTNGAFVVYFENTWDASSSTTVTGITNVTIANRRVGTFSFIGDGTMATAGATSTGVTRDPNGNGVGSGGSKWATGLIAFRPATTAIVTADQGTYAITGQAANLKIDYSLTSANGSYTITGQDATLNKGNSVVAASGSYVITGQDQTLVFSGNTQTHGITLMSRVKYRRQKPYRVSQPDASSNPLGGNAVTANQGSYTITGQAALFSYPNKIVGASTGNYAITGQSADLLYSAGTNRNLAANVGSYLITGQDAAMRYLGVIVPPQNDASDTVMGSHRRGAGLPSGKSISYRRFEQINEIRAKEREAEARAEREKAEKAKEAEAAKKAARAAQAKANTPPGQREIEDVTADQLIAKLTANVKSIVQATISEELDDLHASMGALLEHAAGGGAMPEPAPEVDPMVAPWKK